MDMDISANSSTTTTTTTTTTTPTTSQLTTSISTKQPRSPSWLLAPLKTYLGFGPVIDWWRCSSLSGMSDPPPREPVRKNSTYSSGGGDGEQPRTLHISPSAIRNEPSINQTSFATSTHSPSPSPELRYPSPWQAQRDITGIRSLYESELREQPSPIKKSKARFGSGFKGLQTSTSSDELGDLLGFDQLQISDAGALSLRESKAAYDKRIEAERQEAERVRHEKEEAERQKRERSRLIPTTKFVVPVPDSEREVLKTRLNQSAAIATLKDGTQLRKHDFMTVLQPTAWLNDEIINGYMGLIVQDAIQKWGKSGSVNPVIAFNSFFYAKLESSGPGSVARWVKKQGIAGRLLLEARLILIPICRNSHWTLMTVSPKLRRIEYWDSFGSRDPRKVGLVRDWLRIELGREFKEDEWTDVDTACAKQSNGYDCGVFLLTNAQCLARNVDPTAYDARDMKDQRWNIAAALVRGTLPSRDYAV